MTVIKTGISLDKPLFEKLERLSAEMGVSRSRLLALALEEYIERQQNLKLLRELNAAYGDEQDEEGKLTVQHGTIYGSDLEESW
ncbi:MAG: ribbon-helix-helix protein, CopG family [Anaerolineales bacterium]|nr:ribbon-helix-helix protein, CopG family [Anaerolineales bacterium]